jgi:putative PEP-CTERM system TPR-repeat lipoprotein
MNRPLPFLQRRLGLPALIAASVLTVALSGCDNGDPITVGRDYLKKGDLASAMIHLKAAVQTEPERADLRVLLADALERKHDLPSVEQQLQKALESGGDENTIAPRLALVMLDRNALDELIRAFKDRTLSNPQANSQLRGTVALALLAQRRRGPAQAQIQGAADVPAVRLAQAQLLVADGKPDEALALLNLGDDKTAPWWVLRAAKRIAMAKGDVAGGLAYMQRAHEAVPWNHGVTGEYAEALISADKFDAAAALRDGLRKDAPAFFWTHYLDALLENRAGRLEQAHAAALRALRLSPEHLPAGLLAASTELRRGDVPAAERRLVALVSKNPDSLPALRLLAQSQIRLGQPRAATATLKRGLAMAPGDAQLLSMKADADLADGRVKDAVETLTRMAQARPDDADYKVRLAQAKFQLGDKAAAGQLLEQAATLGAADASVLGRVVATALRMGNVATARKVADLAVSKQPDDPQARLSLAAVQSAQNDRAAAWATTLAVLDKHPTNANALASLAAMTRTPEQRTLLLARHAAAVEAGVQNPQVYRDYAALLRLDAVGSAQPLAVLDKGVRAMPTDVALREALVDELLRSGDGERAVASAQTGATMANAPPSATALLATTYDRLGMQAQAATTWRKLVQDHPERADWKLRLAQIEVAANKPAEARALLRGLITERPSDIQPYLALAKMLAKDHSNEAMAVATEMGKRPEFKDAAALLEGDVLALAGQNEQAIARYEKAAKAGIAPAATLRILPLLDQAKQRDAADRLLDEALRKFPDDTRVVGIAAQRAQARGDAARAVELLQRLVTKTPNDPYLLNDLAWAQLAAGRPEALANARRAATALPNNPNVLHTLGLCLLKAGKRDDSIAALRASANLAPQAALPRLQLAQQLVVAGDRIGAANALRTIRPELLDAAEQGNLAKLKTELGLS